MKRSGPRIDPWGTPERTGVGLDMRLPTLTDWVRPERYECNQEYRLGGRLMEFNLLRRDEWLTESKALVMSRKIPQMEEEESRVDWIVWQAEMRASVVEREGRKPNWLGGIREFEYRKSSRVLAMSFSRSLDKMERRDIGL